MKVPGILDIIRKIDMLIRGMGQRFSSDPHYARWRETKFLQNLKWKIIPHQRVCFMFGDAIDNYESAKDYGCIKVGYSVPASPTDGRLLIRAFLV